VLRQRILTALVLLTVVAVVLLAPIFWPSVRFWPFAGLVGLVCAVTAWEWLRLTLKFRNVVLTRSAVLAGVILCAVMAELMLRTPVVLFYVLFGFICLLWGMPLALVLAASVEPPARSLPLSLLATLLLPAAGLSLFCLYHFYAFDRKGGHEGALFVVSLLALVWVADIAAYFAGRRWGRRKLAPKVSPGKSVEGALAGVAAAAVWILASGQYEGSYGYGLIQRWGVMGAACWAALLAAASILGDLFESLVKRRAGVKDSSRLLPGHGGVWDRVDAILPVAPLALLVAGG